MWPSIAKITDLCVEAASACDNGQNMGQLFFSPDNFHQRPRIYTIPKHDLVRSEDFDVPQNREGMMSAQEMRTEKN